MKIRSQNLTPGQWLINIGPVDQIKLYETAQLVEISVYDGMVKSVAFYWYSYDVLLEIK